MSTTLLYRITANIELFEENSDKQLDLSDEVIDIVLKDEEGYISNQLKGLYVLSIEHEVSKFIIKGIPIFPNEAVVKMLNYRDRYDSFESTTYTCFDVLGVTPYFNIIGWSLDVTTLRPFNIKIERGFNISTLCVHTCIKFNASQLVGFLLGTSTYIYNNVNEFRHITYIPDQIKIKYKDTFIPNAGAFLNYYPQFVLDGMIGDVYTISQRFVSEFPMFEYQVFIPNLKSKTVLGTLLFDLHNLQGFLYCLSYTCIPKTNVLVYQRGHPMVLLD